MVIWVTKKVLISLVVLSLGSIINILCIDEEHKKIKAKLDKKVEDTRAKIYKQIRAIKTFNLVITKRELSQSGEPCENLYGAMSICIKERYRLESVLFDLQADQARLYREQKYKK